ncbi:MAG: Wzz/FepE/Etk N-terminal domain-containing protein, partial [Candidatus Acidiferrales bacterium]
MSSSRRAPIRHPEPEFPESNFPASLRSETPEQRSSILVYLRLVWRERRMLARVLIYALLASTAIAFLIPARYKSTARLMPPDNQSSSSNLGAMVAAATSSFTEDGLQGVASDLLGLKSTSDIFVGVLG